MSDTPNLDDLIMLAEADLDDALDDELAQTRAEAQAHALSGVRILNLESRVGDLESRLSDVESRISNLESNQP